MKKLISLLFIIIMFTLLGCGTFTKTSSQPNPSLIQIKEPIVTKDEYDRIKIDMTYEQTISIIGGEGEKIVETGIPGDKYYIITYQYNGKGDLRANANFTFENGKLICKAQAGLK